MVSRMAFEMCCCMSGVCQKSLATQRLTWRTHLVRIDYILQTHKAEVMLVNSQKCQSIKKKFTFTRLRFSCGRSSRLDRFGSLTSLILEPTRTDQSIKFRCSSSMRLRFQEPQQTLNRCFLSSMTTRVLTQARCFLAVLKLSSM